MIKLHYIKNVAPSTGHHPSSTLHSFLVHTSIWYTPYVMQYADSFKHILTCCFICLQDLSLSELFHILYLHDTFLSKPNITKSLVDFPSHILRTTHLTLQIIYLHMYITYIYMDKCYCGSAYEFEIGIQ